MCLVGTDNQLCYFKEDVIYAEAIFKAKAGARCHHGRLQRASSLEPLLPGTPFDCWAIYIPAVRCVGYLFHALQEWHAPSLLSYIDQKVAHLMNLPVQLTTFVQMEKTTEN